MNEKELYQQKKQAQLDEWKAGVDKLKARASGASAKSQLELNKQIEALEGKIEERKSRLAELVDASKDASAEASEEAWESMKDSMESAWDSMKSALNDVADSIEHEKVLHKKEQYKQKKQAQLNEWKAEVDKLKAKAAGVSTDVQLELHKQIETLESRIEEGNAKLAELVDAGKDTSEEAWESMKDGVESAWDSMKSAYNDAAAKFKK